jgi:hypothetical protein
VRWLQRQLVFMTVNNEEDMLKKLDKIQNEEETTPTTEGEVELIAAVQENEGDVFEGLWI